MLPFNLPGGGEWLVIIHQLHMEVYTRCFTPATAIILKISVSYKSAGT